MKITFFYSTIANIGIEYLSANLKKNGFETDLVFSPLPIAATGAISKFCFFSEEAWAEKILATNPDLIAFSSLSDWHPRNIALAEIIKKIKPSIPIIFGGLHVSSVPEKVINEEAVDYICVGEGEEAIVELATAIKTNTSTENIPNIWCKKNGQIIKNIIRPLRKDPDATPFPDKDLFYGKSPFTNKREYMIFSQMGCPFSCTFCYNSLFKDMYSSDYIRFRKIENVIKELELARDKYNIKKNIFLDDTFNYNIPRMENLLTAYKEKINIPFFCQVLACYMDEKTVKNLEDANCHSVTMGIQTMDKNLRNNILKCPGTRRDIKNAIKMFQKSKIFLVTTVIHKVPFQSDAELKRISVFLKNNMPNEVFLFRLRYYPKTTITNTAHASGILSDADIDIIENCRKIIPLEYGMAGEDKRLLLLTILMGKYIPKRLLVFILRSNLYKLQIPGASLIKFIQTRLEDLYLRVHPFKHKHPCFSIFNEIRYIFEFLKFAFLTAVERIKK